MQAHPSQPTSPNAKVPPGQSSTTTTPNSGISQQIPTIPTPTQPAIPSQTSKVQSRAQSATTHQHRPETPIPTTTKPQYSNTNSRQLHQLRTHLRIDVRTKLSRQIGLANRSNFRIMHLRTHTIIQRPILQRIMHTGTLQAVSHTRLFLTHNENLHFLLLLNRHRRAHTRSPRHLFLILRLQFLILTKSSRTYKRIHSTRYKINNISTLTA